MKIAFLGLGNMGRPMALNLLNAGHTLVVFDPVEAATAALSKAGAEVASSPRAAAATPQVDLVITMLPAAQHVRLVYLGEDGVLAGVPKGIRLVDCSTIDPHTARTVALAAQQQGNPMVDAPVSGGTGGAVAGTLTFMVGGTDTDFAMVRPVLEQLGRNIVHCGGSGNGQVAKVANNMLLGISMIGAAEAMALGVKLGMDPHVLAGVINTSSGRCWSTDTYNPFPGVVDGAPAGRGYTGGFGADLMLKDLGLATEAGKLAGQPVLLGALAQQIYQSFSAQGQGGLDFSAIIRMYRSDGGDAA